MQKFNAKEYRNHSNTVENISFVFYQCMNCSKSHKVSFCFDFVRKKMKKKTIQFKPIFCMLNSLFMRQKIIF